MRKEAVRHWDEISAQDLPAVRDAMLAGFRSERAFERVGKIAVAVAALRRGPSWIRTKAQAEKAVEIEHL